MARYHPRWTKWLPAWWESLFRSRRPAPPRRGALRVEPLESRWLPTTFTPTTFADGGPGSGSLRDGVLQFNADTGTEDDTIQLLAGTYTLTIPNSGGHHETAGLTGDLNLTQTSHHWIIQGAGSSTVIDAGQLQDRAFEIVTPGTQVVFRNLVIQGGLAQEDGTNGTLAGSTDALGGGILNNGGNVTLDHVVLASNAARGGNDAYNGPNAQGGGLFAMGGSFTISDSTIANNQAIGGRGGNGGFALSSTAGNGGNGGAALGGGIYASGGMLTLTNATISTNTAQGGNGGNGGSGLSAVGGNGGNGGAGLGGGIYASSGMLTLTNATISTNTAQGGNGGAGGYAAFSRPGGNGGNGAPGLGGGIYVSTGPLGLTNSTVAFNTAQASLGGAGGFGSPPGIPGTAGPGQGGGVGNPFGTVNALNTLVGDNTAASAPDLSGFLTSSKGHNLIGNSSGGSGYTDTDLLDVDPLLGPLKDNGGPTLTHALLPGSPAIDAGDNTGAPDWDQRGPGFPRIVGIIDPNNPVIDIGAFEVQGDSSGPDRAVSPGGKPLPLDAAALMSPPISLSWASFSSLTPADAPPQGTLAGPQVAVMDWHFASLNPGDPGSALSQPIHQRLAEAPAWALDRLRDDEALVT
jgi:hypothetical protein